MFEKQWEGNSVLEVDKLETSLLRNPAINCFSAPTGELFFIHTH